MPKSPEATEEFLFSILEESAVIAQGEMTSEEWLEANVDIDPEVFFDFADEAGIRFAFDSVKKNMIPHGLQLVYIVGFIHGILAEKRQ